MSGMCSVAGVYLNLGNIIDVQAAALFDSLLITRGLSCLGRLSNKGGGL